MFEDVRTFADFVEVIVQYINIIVGFLASVALLMFMINTFRLIFDASSGKYKAERKKALLWSIIALFVLFSIAGIVRVLIVTFLPDEAYRESWTTDRVNFPHQYPVPIDSLD
jgi:hypothetical protein